MLSTKRRKEFIHSLSKEELEFLCENIVLAKQQHLSVSDPDTERRSLSAIEGSRSVEVLPAPKKKFSFFDIFKIKKNPAPWLTIKTTKS